MYGIETGMFEIPAGGRRYRALELLIKQKRLARTAQVPCVICEAGIGEEACRKHPARVTATKLAFHSFVTFEVVCLKARRMDQYT